MIGKTLALAVCLLVASSFGGVLSDPSPALRQLEAEDRDVPPLGAFT